MFQGSQDGVTCRNAVLVVSQPARDNKALRMRNAACVPGSRLVNGIPAGGRPERTDKLVQVWLPRRILLPPATGQYRMQTH